MGEHKPFYYRPLLSFPYFDEDFYENNGLSISEDEKAIYVEAQLPGIKSDEIEVTLDRGDVCIHAESRLEDKGKKYYRKASSAFSYRVHLPEKVDETIEPEANYVDGILKLSFKKTKGPAPKKINIKVKKS